MSKTEINAENVVKRTPSFLPKHFDVNNIVFGNPEDVILSKVKVGTRVPLYYKEVSKTELDENKKPVVKYYHIDIELDKASFPFGVNRSALTKNGEGKWVVKDYSGKPRLSARLDSTNKRHNSFRQKYEEIEEYIRNYVVNNNEFIFGPKCKKFTEKMANKNWRSQITISKDQAYQDRFEASIREYTEKTGTQKIGTLLCDGDNDNIVIKDVDNFVAHGGLKRYSGTCIYRLRDLYFNADKKMNIRVSFDTIKLFSPKPVENSDGKSKRGQYNFIDETDDEFMDENEETTNVEENKEEKSSNSSDSNSDSESDDSDSSSDDGDDSD